MKETEGLGRPTRRDLGSRGQRYLHGHFTAVAAPAAELAVVPVAPGPHRVVVREAEGLGIATATGDIDHAMALKSLHL